MNHLDGDRNPAEHDWLEGRLRAERMTATPLELDELKLRAKRQAAPATPRLRKGTLMKSRLALTLVVVLGLMMSGTGATLAVQGSSGTGSAATNQYDNVKPHDEGGTAGKKESNTLGGREDSTDVAPANEQADVAPANEQAEVTSGSGSSLPFTGFAAIPLLLGGVLLVSVGGVLRWRARDAK